MLFFNVSLTEMFITKILILVSDCGLSKMSLAVLSIN